MVDTFAQGALLVLAMIAFANYRNGTLGDWLKAKFLNKAAPDTPTQSFFGQFGQFMHGAQGTDGAGGSAPHVLSSPPTDPSTGLGRLLRPVAGGTVTGMFGDARPGHTHEGIDLAVPIGTAVAAAGSGTVIYSGPAAGYGYLLTIDHGNGLTTRYGHLSKLLATVGQTVTAGQQVALSGNTGDSTGPHLHFEVRNNGIAIDPAPYLGMVTA